MQIDIAAQRVGQIAAALEFRIARARDVGALPLEQAIRVHGQRQRGDLLGLALPGRALIEVFARGWLRLGLGRDCIEGGHSGRRDDIGAHSGGAGGWGGARRTRAGCGGSVLEQIL